MKLIKKYMTQILLFESVKNTDERGYFMRSYCQKIFKFEGIKDHLSQINISHNEKKHTLRGYHYQEYPHSESKIISCIKGQIFFSLLCLDKKSKFYLETCNMDLSEDDSRVCYVPKGFATAFLTLKDKTQILYLMSDEFKPNYGRGIRYNDKIINENWPYKPKIISQKDLHFPEYIDKI